MTLIDRHEQKIPLPRAGVSELWTRVQNHFAQDDPVVWRDLAMLALRESSGWTLEQIGTAMGLTRGHVCRRLQSVKQDLRQRFCAEPLTPQVWDMLSDPDKPGRAES